MINIVEKVDGYLLSQRRIYPQDVNRASSAGHPCERKLTYDRLNWQDKTLPDLRREKIFREGREQEQSVLRLLAESGIQVIESQRTFEWKEILLRGHIDGRININGNSPPLEIKGLNQFDYDKLETAQNMLQSKKYWIRSYPAQMQLYCLMSNEPNGILLLKNKTTGELKQIVMPLDYVYAEEIVKKLEKVNKHVAAKTYPDRIDDKSVCQYCDFKHICLPDECSEQIELSDDIELLDLLNQRDQLRKGATEYEEVNDKLKERWYQTKPGIYLVGGLFQVKISTYPRPFYKVPDNVKEQYKEETSCMRALITKLKDQQ